MRWKRQTESEKGFKDATESVCVATKSDLLISSFKSHCSCVLLMAAWVPIRTSLAFLIPVLNGLSSRNTEPVLVAAVSL